MGANKQVVFDVMPAVAEAVKTVGCGPPSVSDANGKSKKKLLSDAESLKLTTSDTKN